MEQRATLEWRNEYSVGDRLIDAQHKKLLQLCTDAEALIGQPLTDDTKGRFHSLLNEISAYAQVHFATEEGLLKRLGYADLKGQEDSHKAYIETMSDLNFQATRGDMDAGAIYRFLSAWWLDHILVGDMQYKPLVQSKAGFVRKPSP